MCRKSVQSVPEDIYIVAIRCRQRPPFTIARYRARQRCHFPAALVIGDQALLLFQSTLFYALSPSQVQFRLAAQRGCVSGNRTRNRAVNKTLDEMALLLSIGRLPLTKPGRMQSAPLTIHIPGLGRLASHPAATANTSGLGLEPARQGDEGWQFHM